MSLIIENLPEAIRTTKRHLRASLPEYKGVFGEVEADMRRRVEEIVTERESGHDVIPIVQYADVASKKVPTQLIGKIKARGACVVRQTFSKEHASGWDEEIAAYVERNNLDARLANRAEDKYFGTLAAAKPHLRKRWRSHKGSQRVRPRSVVPGCFQASRIPPAAALSGARSV